MYSKTPVRTNTPVFSKSALFSTKTPVFWKIPKSPFYMTKKGFDETPLKITKTPVYQNPRFSKNKFSTGGLDSILSY